MRRLVKVLRERWGRALGLVLFLFVAITLASAWRAMGTQAMGERRERMQRSSAWGGKTFVNPQPLHNDMVGAITAPRDANASPTSAVPFAARRKADYETAPASGLAVTWLGHSTTLVEIDGVHILTDPNWSDRASPLTWAGPRRNHPPPLPLAELPTIDAVVISHDHYDHLDMRTVAVLRDLNVRFIVPLGIGAHLAYWGVAPSKITELDWWERTQVAGLEIVATPARHASGRMLVDNDAKLPNIVSIFQAILASFQR